MASSVASAEQLPRRIAVVACALLAAATARADPAIETHPPRLRVEAPCEGVVGEPVPFSVLLQEEWGREGPRLPSAGVDRGARLAVSTTDSLAQVEPQLVLDRADHGHRRSSVVFRTAGLQRIVVDGEAGVSARSNPIRVLARAPAMRVYWGDLHAHLHTPGEGHSGAIDLGEYARLLDEGLAFGRDASLLDFGAFTEHIQTVGGLAVRRPDGRTPWDVILQREAAAQAPGQFVILPGFEWQGNEGDHCVLYPAPGPIDAPADYAALVRSVKDRGGLITAHAVYLPASFDVESPLLDGVEVTRDSKSTEWLGKQALEHGFVRAFLGCSDSHGGALGATSITGLRATALTAEEIFRAIRERRTWATNGERIVLDFAVDDTGDVPRIHVSGTGTAPIDRIEIFRDGEPVAEAHGFPAREEFDFVWEDGGLLCLDGLAGPVAYHARVVQTSANRYDPGERDLAISSPVEVTPTPRNFDAAHARRSGRRDASPGAVLELVRTAWDAFRPSADRPLRADLPPGAAPPSWSDKDIATLRTAVKELDRLAARDSSLAALSHALDVLPDVAAAYAGVAAARARLREAAARSGPTGPLLDSLRRDVDRARVAMERAEAMLHTTDHVALERVWFAARTLAAAHRQLSDEMEAFVSEPAVSTPVVVGETHPVSRVSVPVDPRIALEVGAISTRSRELHAALEKAWGYTSPSALAGAAEPVLRVRVVAEGEPGDARVVRCPGGCAVPLVPARDGWCALLDRTQVPSPGDPPLEIELTQPARLNRVFLEGPRGAPLRVGGRVVEAAATQAGDVVSVVVRVEGAPVAAELVGRSAAEAAERVLWSGKLDVGSRTLAFPASALGDPGRARLRWGFAGWRREAGAEAPGNDVARPLGFGALADGRGAIALAKELVLVDPVGGGIERVSYPEGHTQGAGREFCTAPLGEDTIVRGADGPNGGWAALLTHDGHWKPLAPGPEAGTVASDRSGALEWVVGSDLHRRSSEGAEAAPRRLDATGRLIAVDPVGRALLRTASGEIVRIDPSDGRVMEHVPGPALCVDASGAVLSLAGLDRRHAELATGVLIARYPGDGSRSGPFPVAIRTSPVSDPPVLAAPGPGESILLLGGSTSWRAGPENDWFGVTVERWQPLWVGQASLK